MDGISPGILKRKAVLVVVVLLLAAGTWFFARRMSALPHLRLATGDEFKVLKISHGDPDQDCSYGRAPELVYWLWDHLPRPLQAFIPSPPAEVDGWSQPGPSLSIWYGCFTQPAGLPEQAASSLVIMTADSGERTCLRWPNPSGNLRQLSVLDPPVDSKQLHFQLWVDEQLVDFAIANPAYAPLAPASTAHSTANKRLRKAKPFEVNIFEEGKSDPDVGLGIRLPKVLVAKSGFRRVDLTYSIINHLGADLFVHGEPKVSYSFDQFAAGFEPKVAPYVALLCPDKTDDKAVTISSSVPAPVQGATTLRVSIEVEGYFADTGQPFSGSDNFNIPVTFQ